jgi:hypothetical protein
MYPQMSKLVKKSSEDERARIIPRKVYAFSSPEVTTQ